MLVLEKIGEEVFYNGVKLKINKQQTKNDGKGDPVVYVKDLPEANGQKWVSVNKLREGENKIECQAHSRVTSSQKYELTQEEQERVNELQSEINAIINNAKKRYVPKVDVNKLSKMDITKLSNEDRQRYIDLLTEQVNRLEGLKTGKLFGGNE